MVYVNINYDPHPIIMPNKRTMQTFITTNFSAPNGVSVEQADARWEQIFNMAVCMNGYAQAMGNQQAIYRYRLPSPDLHAWRVDVLVNRVYPIVTEPESGEFWNSLGIINCMTKEGDEYYIAEIFDNQTAEGARTNVHLNKIVGHQKVPLANITMPAIAAGASIFSLQLVDSHLRVLLNNAEILSTPAAGGDDNAYSGLMIDSRSFCTPIIKAFSALAASGDVLQNSRA
jgi:hypothetical protein